MWWSSCSLSATPHNSLLTTPHCATSTSVMTVEQKTKNQRPASQKCLHIGTEGQTCWKRSGNRIGRESKIVRKNLHQMSSFGFHKRCCQECWWLHSKTAITGGLHDNPCHRWYTVNEGRCSLVKKIARAENVFIGTVQSFIQCSDADSTDSPDCLPILLSISVFTL